MCFVTVLEINEAEYSVFVSKWTECTINAEEHDRAIQRYNTRIEEDSLVHTPRLGLQRRQVQCRRKDGQFVESMYCGNAISHIGTTRVCVMREDCSLAEWLPWRPRADGALVRTRRLRRLAQGGGKECEVVEEVRPAALEASAHWTPGPWGRCRVAVAQPATPVPCPRDCEVGEGGEWGACQPIDGCPLYPVQELTATGYSVRHRRVTSAESGGGANCPPLEEKRTCTMPRCASWKALPWGPCVLSQPHSTCGPGRRMRELQCIGHDGKEAQRAWCSGSSAPARTERCRIACPGDCVVSAWSAWSPCTAPCAAPARPRPTRTRTRQIIAHASPNGWPCPSEDQLIQNETCNNHACATYSWLATPWGPCERRHQDYIPVTNYTDLQEGEPYNESDEEEPCVEEGQITRNVMCVQNNADVVRDSLCLPLRRPQSRRACTLRCRRGCRVEAWMPWSPCPNTCEPGKQVRVRNVNGGPNCGAVQEVRDCPVPPSCRAREAAWVAGEWSTCRLPPGQRCGLGYRLRSIWCGSDSHRVEAGACAGQLVPPSVAACIVTCDRMTHYGGPNCGAVQEVRDCPVPPSCRAREAAWVAGEWSTCRLPPGQRCGLGYRLRSIWCGSDSHRVEAGACAGQLVPPSVAACIVTCDRMVPLTCDVICEDPLKYLDASDPDVPICVCKTVTLELLPADSDCILPPGLECGEGRALRSARCMAKGRDVPMDVCKKYHPLTGPRRVREASTDGFAYDEEFPALVRGACSVRCARDCAAGPWAPWGACSAEPGSRAAFRFRTREVIEEGSAGGRECGATLQRATCVLPEPAWRVGEWSVCAPQQALCGRAIINRTVICQDSNGVKLDDSECVVGGAGQPAAREATCRAPCPADCVVSAWSEWSPCEQTKWGGRRDRTRVVLRPADEGGAPCPHLVGGEPCAPHTYSWHVAPWDDCQPLGGSPCGEGTKRRSVRCLRSDGVFVNDTFCPNATATEARESWCYVPCGVDCELGEWSAWDTAACACGDATFARHMRRTRQRLTAAVWPGRACPPTEQRAPCPREPCLRLIARPSLGCHVQEDETCEVECGCKESELGQPGPWGAWGPCRGGSRSRTRQLLVPPSRPCRTSSRYVTIEWANCTGSPDEISDLLSADREEKPRRAWMDRTSYHDGYIEGSGSVLLAVWVASMVLLSCGTYMFYRGLVHEKTGFEKHREGVIAVFDMWQLS
ncbi:Thrombospondin type-1 domain-containing protein 7B [Papilio machaon]|uniref:Thrombospondin type-1 domain-containing protein 7B n=1 Tax=Papilio machaon TaxID=76193 RepID=A0A194QSJ5_PAPMA|nr:Thrombospondin type-1 domain-containing protein 7B [Papilio machaon]